MLHDPQLFEYTDVKPQIWRANCKVIRRFLTGGGLVPLTPVLFEGQLYLFVLLSPQTHHVPNKLNFRM